MRKFLTILLLVLFVGEIYAQELQFSQYFASSLYLNPANAGVYSDPSFHINHKRQPNGALVNHDLTQASFVYPFHVRGINDRINGGVGVMAYNETSGLNREYQSNGVFATYAHNFQLGILGSDLIMVGAQIGYENKSLSLSNLLFGSQYNQYTGRDDDRFPSPVSEFDERYSNATLNLGVIYYYNRARNYLIHNYSAFSGVAISNINFPRTQFVSDSINVDPIYFKYHGGVEFKVGKFFLIPSTYIQHRQLQTQFNTGIYMSYAFSAQNYIVDNSGFQIIAGSWYRYQDSFIFMAGIFFESFVFRASYDLNTTLFAPDRNVKLTDKGSMEISIQYSIRTSKGGLKKISNPLF